MFSRIFWEWLSFSRLPRSRARARLNRLLIVPGATPNTIASWSIGKLFEQELRLNRDTSQSFEQQSLLFAVGHHLRGAEPEVVDRGERQVCMRQSPPLVQVRPQHIASCPKQVGSKVCAIFDSVAAFHTTHQGRLHEVLNIAVDLVGKKAINTRGVTVEQLTRRNSITCTPSLKQFEIAPHAVG